MAQAAITGVSLISPAGRTVAENVRACMAGQCAGIDPGLPAPMNRVPIARLAETDELTAAVAAVVCTVGCHRPPRRIRLHHIKLKPTIDDNNNDGGACSLCSVRRHWQRVVCCSGVQYC